MTLVCSANARKRFRLSVSGPRADAAPWHEHWRLDMLVDAPCGYGAMVTNLETLFTILVPARECTTFDRLLDHFRMRLQFTLIYAGSAVEVDSAPPRLVSGNPRRVIGTMNDMKFALALEAEEKESSGDGRDMEDYLNRTPCGAIDYAYPCERFYAMAKA